nr:hypothetical protein CFP56_24532 [Quercus suber]
MFLRPAVKICHEGASCDIRAWIFQVNNIDTPRARCALKSHIYTLSCTSRDVLDAPDDSAIGRTKFTSLFVIHLLRMIFNSKGHLLAPPGVDFGRFLPTYFARRWGGIESGDMPYARK